MRNIGEPMRLLMERAGPHLTEDDLRELGGASDVAYYQAKSLADSLHTLGAMISSNTDGDHFGHKDDLASLLWSIAGTADSIGALIELSETVDTLRTFRPRKPHQTTES